MKNYKKGDVITIRLDGKGPKETVTVMSDFKAGQSGLSFITLKRKVGSPYTITKSRLEKSIVESITKSELRKIIKEELLKEDNATREFANVIDYLRKKVYPKLNDDDLYRLNMSLKNWFNKNI